MKGLEVRQSLWGVVLALGLLLAVAVGILVTGQTQAQEPRLQGGEAVGANALGTAFTYQGRLTDSDSGEPVAGPCKLRFTLYASATGNDPVGNPQEVPDVNPEEGYFSVDLDFGANAFQGEARYLGIEVDCGAGYGALDPRTRLNAAPYALYALNHPKYANVVVVAKSGGDFTTIQGALDSITDASDTNRYLVWVAPGTYNERVTMKQYVDVEGAGQYLTKIAYTGSAIYTTGTVVGAPDTALRNLSVENSGGAEYAVAIYGIPGPGMETMSLHNVSARAHDGTKDCYGVYNDNDSTLYMDIVHTSSYSCTRDCYGVYNTNASAIDMTRVSAGGSRCTEKCYGVYQDKGAYGILAQGSATAAFCDINHAVHTAADSSIDLVDSDVRASLGSTSYGVYNDSPDTTSGFRNSYIYGQDYGIYNEGDGFVEVDNSEVAGLTAAIRNGTGFTTRVGASKLYYGVQIDGGTVDCYACYDLDYSNAYGVGSCPP